MKFKDKYPNIRPSPAGYQEAYKSEEVSVETSLFYSGRYYDCFVCHEITPFIEINFEAHVCSEECRNIMYENYDEALRNTPEGREGVPIFITNDNPSSSDKPS